MYGFTLYSTSLFISVALDCSNRSAFFPLIIQSSTVNPSQS